MVATLEHVNICVPDPTQTAALMEQLFDWHIRWQDLDGADGVQIHVGGASSYLALYAPRAGLAPPTTKYRHQAALNHIGIVVEDLDRAESRVRAQGITPRLVSVYEPGRRFYFDGPDGVEYEVVSYTQ